MAPPAGDALFRGDVPELVDRDLDRLAVLHALRRPAVARDRNLLHLADLREALARQLLLDLILGHLPDIGPVLRRALRKRRRRGADERDQRQPAELRSQHVFLPRLPLFTTSRIDPP